MRIEKGKGLISVKNYDPASLPDDLDLTIPDNQIIATALTELNNNSILEVGSGARDEAGKLVPLDVKRGDKILFGKWSGTEVKMNGEEYLIMKESDIMGIVTSGKKKK